MILESAITDVLCIILSFSLIGALKYDETGNLNGSIEIATMLLEIGESLGVAALIGIAAGILWPSLESGASLSQLDIYHHCVRICGVWLCGFHWL